MDWKRMNIRLFKLDHRVQAYVSDCLAKGHLISKILLGTGGLFKAPAFTYLTEETPEEKIYKFYNGGVVTPLPLKTVNNSGILMSRVHNTNDELADLIIELVESENCICVFEEYYFQATDAVFQNRIGSFFTIESKVYYLISKNNNSKANVKKIIMHANNPECFVGIISRTKFNLKNHFDAEGLKEIVKMAYCAIVGAYDGESFIVLKQNIN